ncbi:putative tick transposon [Trichonephila clavipes]|nr:putative tick transposon [Trichonephila clavipes]
MYSDTLNYVTSCCRHKRKPCQKQAYGKTPIPTRPNEFISIDIVGPVRSHNYVLTVLDHFSKHAELFPITNIQAPTIARKIIQYITTFGRPGMILSDLGTQFTADIFKQITNMTGIAHHHTTSRNPKANGQSERINSSLKTSILSLADHKVDFAVAVHKSFYNGTKHSSHGFTPDIVHFGRNLSLIFDTIAAPIETPLLTEEGYTNTLLSSLQILQQQIRTNLQTQQDKQHARLNINTMQRAPKVGDVYTLSGNQFRPKFDGPFEELWFQQDGATCHTARATIDLLKDTFGDRLILRFGPVNWPPRSCDLTSLDYFLWDYVKSLVYADKPQTLDHLKDNIRRVIANIRPQTLEKVIEKIGRPDWTTSEPAVAVLCQKSYLKCNATRLSFE